MIFSSAYAAVMGDPAAADRRRDRRHQRRAEPQLHHQRHPSGAAGAQARLPAPRHGQPRSRARRGGRRVPARHRGDRRRLQHARRSRAARSDRGAGAGASTRAFRRTSSWSSTTPTASAPSGDRARHRGADGRACRRAGRDPRQGARRERRLRGRLPDARRAACARSRPSTSTRTRSRRARRPRRRARWRSSTPATGGAGSRSCGR